MLQHLRGAESANATKAVNGILHRKTTYWNDDLSCGKTNVSRKAWTKPKLCSTVAISYMISLLTHCLIFPHKIPRMKSWQGCHFVRDLFGLLQQCSLCSCFTNPVKENSTTVCINSLLIPLVLLPYPIIFSFAWCNCKCVWIHTRNGPGLPA